MTDFLVCTRTPKGTHSFAVFRDELPQWWASRESDYGRGNALVRQLNADESGMTLAELAALWHSEKRDMPAARVPAMAKQRGVKLGLSQLASLLVRPLYARGFLTEGDTLRLEEARDGGILIDVAPSQK